MNVSEQTTRWLETLGGRIRDARIDANMSQVELGERIGVTRYTVGALENGSVKVAVGTVFEAARILDLPLSGAKPDDLTRTPGDAILQKSVKLDDDYF